MVINCLALKGLTLCERIPEKCNMFTHHSHFFILFTALKFPPNDIQLS